MHLRECLLWSIKWSIITDYSAILLQLSFLRFAYLLHLFFLNCHLSYVTFMCFTYIKSNSLQASSFCSHFSSAVIPSISVFIKYRISKEIDSFFLFFFSFCNLSGLWIWLLLQVFNSTCSCNGLYVVFCSCHILIYTVFLRILTDQVCHTDCK